ncbi:hypothetical protein V8C40DRAFT_250583 [Trichoderma camerunense]
MRKLKGIFLLDSGLTGSRVIFDMSYFQMPSRSNRDFLHGKRLRLETQIEKHKTGTHAHVPETSQSHRSTAEYCITHIVNCLIIIEPCLIYTLVQLRQRENTA